MSSSIVNYPRETMTMYSVTWNPTWVGLPSLLLVCLCGGGKEWWKHSNVRNNLIFKRKFWHVWKKSRCTTLGDGLLKRLQKSNLPQRLFTLSSCFSHNVQENGCGCTLRKWFLGAVREKRPEYVNNHWRRQQSAFFATASGLYANCLHRRCENHRLGFISFWFGFLS